MIATGQVSLSCADVATSMRGIDFYQWKDFVRALVRGTRNFKTENGYLPNLVSPVTFNEHIFARKYFAALPVPSLADKLRAKDYVRARVGDGVIPCVAWVGEDVRELFAINLQPGRYVLKANHGWHWNMILELPDDLSTKRCDIEQQAMTWIRSRFGYEWGEWQYCIIKPKLFLEEFIDFNGNKTPDDYKFYCFDGKVRLIEVSVDRPQTLTAFYTCNWKYIPVTYGEAPVQRARPHNLAEMIRVAEAIAAELEFARIDLYSDGKTRIKFGEITFTPGDAGLGFSDMNFDRWLGAQFGRGRANTCCEVAEYAGSIPDISTSANLVSERRLSTLP
jgi:hypothetical protein